MLKKVQKITPNDSFIELELATSTRISRQVKDETHEDQHELHDRDDAHVKNEPNTSDAQV